MRPAQRFFLYAFLVFFVDSSLLSNPQSKTTKQQPANQTAKPKQSKAIPETPSPEDLIAESRKSVVVIQCIKKSGNDSLGAGFVVGSRQLLSTNAHVVNSCSEIRIQTAREGSQTSAKLRLVDWDRDIAILRKR